MKFTNTYRHGAKRLIHLLMLKNLTQNFGSNGVDEQIGISGLSIATVLHKLQRPRLIKLAYANGSACYRVLGLTQKASQS